MHWGSGRRALVPGGTGSLTPSGFVPAPEPVTEVPNSQPRGRGAPDGEYEVGLGWGPPRSPRADLCSCSCPCRRGDTSGHRGSGPAAAPCPVPGSYAPRPALDLTPRRCLRRGHGLLRHAGRLRTFFSCHCPTEPVGQPWVTTLLPTPCRAELGARGSRLEGEGVPGVSLGQATPQPLELRPLAVPRRLLTALSPS